MGQYYSVEQLTTDAPKYAMAYLLKCLEEEAFVTYGRMNRHIEKKLGIPNGRIVRHQGHTVGAMMDLLLEHFEDAPLINALTTGPDSIPGDGVAGYINNRYRKTHKKKWADLSKKKRLKLVELIRQDVRSYTKWNELYRSIWGQNPADNFPDDELNEQDGSVSSGSGHGGPAESNEHKALKDWVSENPSRIGVPKRFGKGKLEYKLLSGDVVDVLFTDGKSFFTVEVKSIISGDDDFRRGLYQCVKYQAVLKAQQLPVKADVTAILVTERDLGSELKSRAKALDIHHVSASIKKNRK